MSARVQLSLFCIAAPLAALVSALAIATSRGDLIIIAVPAVWAVAAYPAVSVIVIAAICQELVPAGSGHAETLFTIGHQLYFTNFGRLPLALWLAAIAATSSFFRWKAAGAPRLGSRLIPFLIALLATFAIFLSVANHSPLLTALGQDGRPFIILFLTWFVAATIDVQAGGRRRFRAAAAGGIVTAATIGLADLYFRHGSGISASDASNVATNVSRFMLFYDTALPALAGAIFVALLLSGPRGRWALGTLAASVWILVFSFRRSVWLALIMVMAVLFAMRRLHTRLVIRIILGVAVMGIFLGILDATILRTIANEFDTAFRAVTGSASANDVSTSGHLQDIRQGWIYSMERPILGWGPDISQLPGLFEAPLPGARLYLHDEYLMDWIRFGIAGLATEIALLGTLAWRSLTLLHHKVDCSLDQVAAAAFLLIMPICAVTAPFLSTTSRWPLLVGLAAGLVNTSRANQSLRKAIAKPTFVAI